MVEIGTSDRSTSYNVRKLIGDPSRRLVELEHVVWHITAIVNHVSTPSPGLSRFASAGARSAPCGRQGRLVQHRDSEALIERVANVRFFGVEIAVARIDGSRPAALFRLRGQPNDWHAQV